MKKIALIIAFVIAVGNAFSQPALGKVFGKTVVIGATKGLLNAEKNIKQASQQAQSQLNRQITSQFQSPLVVLSSTSLPISPNITHHNTPIQIPSCKFVLPRTKIMTMQDPIAGENLKFPSQTNKSFGYDDITYKKETSIERRGSGYMTLYNLMITNHKDVNLYVYGTVHIEGTPADEPYYFAGMVPAHGTKCLLTTIDEDFNEIRIIKYQEDL